jgi:hypothetical protein
LRTMYVHATHSPTSSNLATSTDVLRLENGWSCNPQRHRTTYVLDRVPRSGRSAPTPRMDGTVASRHRMDFEQSRCFPHAKRLRPTCRKLHSWEAADAPRDSQVPSPPPSPRTVPIRNYLDNQFNGRSCHRYQSLDPDGAD